MRDRLVLKGWMGFGVPGSLSCFPPLVLLRLGHNGDKSGEMRDIDPHEHASVP
jgi:hypothetical protein